MFLKPLPSKTVGVRMLRSRYLLEGLLLSQRETVSRSLRHVLAGEEA